MLKNIQSGIYAITPTSLRADELLNAVEDTLSSGIEIIQYRFDDCINFDERLKTATKLKKICLDNNACFIINNDYLLAEYLGTGLHVGPDLKDLSFLLKSENIELTGLSCKSDISAQKNDLNNTINTPSPTRAYPNFGTTGSTMLINLSLIHISEPTRQAEISYAVFCL